VGLGAGATGAGLGVGPGAGMAGFGAVGITGALPVGGLGVAPGAGAGVAPGAVPPGAPPAGGDNGAIGFPVAFIKVPRVSSAVAPVGLAFLFLRLGGTFAGIFFFSFAMLHSFWVQPGFNLVNGVFINIFYL